MKRRVKRQVLCIDHCKLDIIIIDEETGLSCEVYVQTVVDARTSMIGGHQTVRTAPRHPYAGGSQCSTPKGQAIDSSFCNLRKAHEHSRPEEQHPSGPSDGVGTQKSSKPTAMDGGSKWIM
jgi:hypothetical protein